jgi:hypothetical protein
MSAAILFLPVYPTFRGSTFLAGQCAPADPLTQWIEQRRRRQRYSLRLSRLGDRGEMAIEVRQHAAILLWAGSR